MTEYILRKETPADWAEVEYLTREAFWDVYRPGCDEHLIVHNFRNHPDCIDALCYVAEQDGRIVGHILYSYVHIEGKTSTQQAILFGPLSVLPKLQRKGVGSALIRHTLALAKEMGFPGVITEGNPVYYHRFGFDDAAKLGIVGENGWSAPELMALEFKAGALQSGTVRYSPLYSVDQVQLAEFEKQFPYKAKRAPRPSDLA